MSMENNKINSSMELNSIFKRLMDQTVDPHFVPNRTKPWKNAKRVQLHFFFGPRGSGKSTKMEETGEHYKNEGISTWHIWGARSFENLFWCVNKHCKETYEKYEKILPEEMVEQLESRPHCRCYRSYRVLIINPEYREWDMESVKTFNCENPYWSSFEEFKEAVVKGLVSPELKKGERILLFEGKLRKPDYLIKDLETIKIANVPIPKNNESQEAFKKAFFKAALDARREDRVLVFNPSLCEGEDKFKIIGQMLILAFEYANENLIELTEEQVGKMRGFNYPIPYSQWTKREKGWHKVHIIINELRSIAPTNKFSPQKGSTDSKRPMVDLAPELRHVNIWLSGDLQSPQDLNQSLKALSNTVIITGGDSELLGEEYIKFFKIIEGLREREFTKWGYEVKSKDDEKYVPIQIKNIVNKKFPRIEELDKNKAYVTWNNNEFLLETFNFPSFHHRQEGENFWQITGIKSWINQKKVEKEASKEDKKDKKLTRNKKQMVHALCDLATDIFIKTPDADWKDIPGEVLKYKEKLKKELDIPDSLIDKFCSLSGKSLNNKVRGYVDLKDKLDKSKLETKFDKNRQ